MVHDRSWEQTDRKLYQNPAPHVQGSNGPISSAKVRLSFPPIIKLHLAHNSSWAIAGTRAMVHDLSNNRQAANYTDRRTYYFQHPYQALLLFTFQLHLVPFGISFPNLALHFFASLISSLLLFLISGERILHPFSLTNALFINPEVTQHNQYL